MSKYWVMVGAATVAALTTAGAVRAEPATSPRILTVSGEGDVKTVPDEAVLSAGVVSEAPSADAALAANRQAMTAVFAELKREGIPDRAIATSEFSVNAEYSSNQNGNVPQHITGYRVDNTVTVTLDDLSKVGAAIDALVASGANSMGGVSFVVKDSKPLLRQARQDAVKDAIARAETYASAAGLKLGRVLSLGEGGENPGPRPLMHEMVMVTAARTPISPGETNITADVTITYEIQ